MVGRESCERPSDPRFEAIAQYFLEHTFPESKATLKMSEQRFRDVYNFFSNGSHWECFLAQRGLVICAFDRPLVLDYLEELSSSLNWIAFLSDGRIVFPQKRLVSFKYTAGFKTDEVIAETQGRLNMVSMESEPSVTFRAKQKQRLILHSTRRDEWVTLSLDERKGFAISYGSFFKGVVIQS